MLTKHTNAELIGSIERIEGQICFIRGVKIMLDADLAMLYQAETTALSRAVERNLDWFPEDFMFWMPRPPVFGTRFHRTWCRYAFVRSYRVSGPSR